MLGSDGVRSQSARYEDGTAAASGPGMSRHESPSRCDVAGEHLRRAIMSVAMQSAPTSLMRRITFVPLLFILFVLPTQTQENRRRIDVSQLGPQVGDRVPEFTLLDQTGKAQSLQSIMGRRGAMLVFVRSADW